jgi:hypothetical protein
MRAGGGLNGFRPPQRLRVPQRLRSLRSLGEPANALRRKPHDNPPADAGARSPVRLLTSSTNRFQRCETAALDSAPAEPGAHRGPPTRPASTNWAHRSRTRCGPPHAPEGFDARGVNAPRPTRECGSFASSLTAPNGMRATTGCTSVSPGTRSARPGEGDGGRHATAFPESRPTSCPAVHVPRPG